MGNNTAGQVFLKSMFNLTDGSMVLLVTGRGFHPDGTVFSFDGVVPDEKITDETMDLRKYAAEYLAKKNGF
jgi:C-terminal processing protease CtpA/Prc